METCVTPHLLLPDRGKTTPKLKVTELDTIIVSQRDTYTTLKKEELENPKQNPVLKRKKQSVQIPPKVNE